MNLCSLARTCPASRELLVRRISDEKWHVDDAARAAGISTRTIARRLRMPRSTVCRILRRAGISRLRDLDPPTPVRCYEKQRPGELVHVDIKKLGRFARAWFATLGIRIERVISDNGSGYRSFVFAQLCKLSLIRHSIQSRIGRKRTAKPSGSFRRCKENARTPGPTTRPASDEKSCDHGYGTTTTEGLG